MAMSERQKQLRLQEHAKEEDEKILDVFNCVERLHDADLRKAIVTEKGEWVLTKIPRHDRPPGKASFQRLLCVLPRHIMGCLLARQPCSPPDGTTALLTDCSINSATCFGHITKALQLLCNLSDAAAQNRALRTEVLASPGFALEVVDAINMVLLAVAGPEAQRCLDAAAGRGGDMQDALDRAAVVPNALRALAYAFTATAAEPAEAGLLTWDTITEALLQHPRGAVLLDAAFDATRTLVLAVRAALCSQASSGDDVYGLAFSAGGALELISYLCTTPLFYYRLMLHDPMGAAPLRLVLACLSLHDAPLAAPPYARMPPPPRGAHGAAAPPPPQQQQQPGAVPAASRPPIPAAPVGALSSFTYAQPPYLTEKGKGAAELLVARGFALVVMLSEFEEPSYWDQLFGHQDTRRLAHEVLDRAVTYIAQVLLRPSTAVLPAAAGEAQMSINVLRAAELFCDDSNFKPGLVQRLSLELGQLLSADAPAFKARWRAGEEAVSFYSKDELLVNSVSNYAMDGVARLEKAARKLFAGGGKQPHKMRVGQQLALERAVLLYKVMGNLHCEAEGGAAGAEDTFAGRLATALRPSPPLLAQVLSNMRQLHQLLQPFGPPQASEATELVAEVDVRLFTDLVATLERSQPQPVMAAAVVPVQPAVPVQLGQQQLQRPLGQPPLAQTARPPGAAPQYVSLSVLHGTVAPAPGSAAGVAVSARPSLPGGMQLPMGLPAGFPAGVRLTGATAPVPVPLRPPGQPVGAGLQQAAVAVHAPPPPAEATGVTLAEAAAAAAAQRAAQPPAQAAPPPAPSNAPAPMDTAP